MDACERFLRAHLDKRIFVKGVTNYAAEPNDRYTVTMGLTGFALAR
jgi:hypothetical protein